MDLESKIPTRLSPTKRWRRRNPQTLFERSKVPAHVSKHLTPSKGPAPSIFSDIQFSSLTKSSSPAARSPIAYPLPPQIPSTMSDQQQTISISSLLLLVAFTALTIRYFFFGKPSVSTPRADPRAANPADIEQIASMFPQIGRREIIWDLQRNGGSVAATTERILSRGRLDQVRAMWLGCK